MTNIEKNIILIGKNSFLCKNFVNFIHFVNLKNYRFIVLSHDEFFNLNLCLDIDPKKPLYIVNFSQNPIYRLEKYNEKNDIDLKIVNHLLVESKNKNFRYIFLSSRMVYLPENQWYPTENSLLGGIGNYGINKLITEHALSLRIKNLTILRIANVFGFEFLKKESRSTFFSFLLNSLHNTGYINLDIKLSTKKDFLPVYKFCEILYNFINNDFFGIYNIGSGIPLEVSEIVKSVISGFKKGEIRVLKEKKNDNFVLNIKKLKKIMKIEISKKNIIDYAFILGERLKHENE